MHAFSNDLDQCDEAVVGWRAESDAGRLVRTSHAPELLELAAGQNPEGFARTVQRVRTEREGKTWPERQHAARSVKFFSDEYGCIGKRGLLPPAAGTMLKNTVTTIADEAWRAAHPERASILGGHNDEPYERRLADGCTNNCDRFEVHHEPPWEQGGRTNLDAPTSTSSNSCAPPITHTAASRASRFPNDSDRCTWTLPLDHRIGRRIRTGIRRIILRRMSEPGAASGSKNARLRCVP